MSNKDIEYLVMRFDKLDARMRGVERKLYFLLGLLFAETGIMSFLLLWSYSKSALRWAAWATARRVYKELIIYA